MSSRSVAEGHAYKAVCAGRWRGEENSSGLCVGIIHMQSQYHMPEQKGCSAAGGRGRKKKRADRPVECACPVEQL